MIRNFNLILVTEEKMILESENEIALSLALGIISSYLRENGIEVLLTDTNKIAATQNYTQEELRLLSNIYDKDKILGYISGGEDQELDQIAAMFMEDISKNHDAYGISIGADFSMLQIHLGFIFAAYLKKITGKPIFIGGNNITYLYIFKDFYKELLENVIDNFDYVIKGPGECVIFEIIQGLNNNRPKSYFEEMDGLLRILDGRVNCNKERDPIVIRPNWDGLDMEDYSYPFVKNQRENENIYYRFPISLTNKIIQFNKTNIKERKLFIPYIFNYNCIYKCAFCTQSDSERSGLIVGQVRQVVDDIEYLCDKYNSNYFYFLNNYFPSSINFIKEFRDELNRRNLKIYWSDCGRVNGLTLEKIQLLHECGCRKLVFGFESASEKVLNLIDKRLEVQEVLDVLKRCKQVGIWADLEIIIGLPYEREEEFKDTYHFLKDYQELVNNFWLNEYFVVPNSLLGKYPERYGIELIRDFINYSEIMEKNKIGFLKKSYIDLTSNARLWGFNEINEYRGYEQMKVENEGKMEQLSKLRNPEFNQLFDFYNKMIHLRNSKK